MSQSKPEYEHLKEFRTIAEKLVNMYPEVLDGIDTKVIQGVVITNKDPKDDDKDKYEIRNVPYPIRMDTAFDYYVIFNQKIWDGFDEAHQNALVMKALLRISKEGDAKVVPYDLKDHAIMVRKLGVDYLDNQSIPNILTTKVDWTKE